MRSRETDAFQDIFSALARDSATLAHKHYALLRLETGIALRRVLTAILFAVLGMVATATAMVFLGIAMFEWLATILSSRAMAALAVSGIAIVVAALVLMAAHQLFLRTSFLPRRTLASLCRISSTFFGEMRDG